MRRALLLAAVVLLAGCGDGSAVSSGEGDKPRLAVFAAEPLRTALTACAKDFPDATPTLRFGASAELAAEIGRGAPVDVLAAGNRLAETLAREGKLEQPVAFAAVKGTAYGAGVGTAAAQPDLAEAFVDDLLAGGCHEALLAAGFGEPR